MWTRPDLLDDQKRSQVAARGVRPAVDGKFLSFGGERFYVRGVTYGTFAGTELGLFPEAERVRRDFAAMAEAGANTVRTYTVPDGEIFDLAEEAGLKLLVGVWWEDPLYEASPGRDAWAKARAAGRTAVREAARAFGNHPAVLGFVLGNEIPAHIVRWHGRRKVERLLRELHETGKEAAPEALFSYANYPTTEYLDTGFFDFDCFNVFLEDEVAYRRYLAQLQIDAGDRPLVLTELGLDSGSHGEGRQAEVLDWQLRAAAEHGLAGTCVFSWTDEWWVRGEKVGGWSFGLTREDRSPKPALEVVARHYGGDPLGFREGWPRVSVVVCAYNAEKTLAETLESLTRLDYPDYEVLVVDDGSTDSTAEIAARFPVRLVSGGRLGLSGARNLGLENAAGEVVAYIDADARADRDWLKYAVVGLDRPGVAGVGGPNLPPPEDPPTAQCIARAPGGPVHVLLDNERAEHVPGCNMAFWRDRLSEIGGFDPIYRAAGDDVDVCWKLQDLGYGIRFHPAAIVWHHPRGRVREFWGQQVGYGRAETMVARNHPDKFNGLGQAIWRGVIYGPASVLPGRSFVYSGKFGEAPFQRLYGERRNFRVQTVLYLLLGLGLLAFFDPHLWEVPVLGFLALLVGYLVHGVRTARREGVRPAWRWGPLIGLLHLLQPAAREWGRLRSRSLAFPPPSELESRFPALRRVGRGLFCAEGVEPADRTAFLEELRERLRTRRLDARGASAWEEADLACPSALFWEARMVSYAREGWFCLRLSYGLRRRRLALAALAALFVAAWPPNLVAGVANLRDGVNVFWSPGLGAAVALVGLAAVLAERWAFGRRLRRALTFEPEKGPARRKDGAPSPTCEGRR
jgi:O-antigen biosynthesis protein